MLIEIINQGLARYCGSYNNNSTAVSLYLISFLLEKYIFCDVCGLRSQSCESNSVLYITPTYTSSMQELISRKGNKNEKSAAFHVKGTLGMPNVIVFYSFQSIWLSLLIGLDTQTTMLPKIGAVLWHNLMANLPISFEVARLELGWLPDIRLLRCPDNNPEGNG